MSLRALLPYGAEALNFFRADIFLGSRHRGFSSVIALHSVVRDRRDYFFDSLRTSASFLESLITHYRSSGVDIVSLDEMLRRLREGSETPSVSFTFDDGYKDNLTLALPIFERHGAPIAVLVTNCFIDGTINNWWMGLAEILKKTDLIEVEALDRRFVVTTFKEKLRVYRALNGAVTKGTVSGRGLEALFNKYRVSVAAAVANEALTEADLRALSEHPLVTLGGHTVNHPHLARLSREDARREMADNKAWLETLTGEEVRHFAYPFGGHESCGDREFALAEEIGFETGLTTRIGNLNAEHLARPTALPRLQPFQQHESIRQLEFQRSGAVNALASGFGRTFALAPPFNDFLECSSGALGMV